MYKKTEQEIMAGWNANHNEPLVTICCVTYNHKAYLAQALKSFLMQKTKFPFEILIHDDASTDGTTDIVIQYANNYPNIIKTVIQTENQYSQHPIISPKFLWPIAKGKYIAMCEGDDFWTDGRKLQYQVECMLAYPECHISFHLCATLNNKGQYGEITNYGMGKKVFTSSEVIRGGGGFMTTPSVMYHRSVIESLPGWFLKVPVGDYYSQILGAIRGGALYLPKNYACYRLFTSGSWTLNEAAHSLKNKNITELADGHVGSLTKLKALIQQTNHVDIDFATAYQLCRCATLALLEKDYKQFKITIIRSWCFQSNIGFKQLLMYLLKDYPSLLFFGLKNLRKINHFYR